VKKKNTGKIQVCIDFCNLKKLTPKDEYPVPIADMFINNASRHRVLTQVTDGKEHIITYLCRHLINAETIF
jgi:hypothetical protein